MAIIGKFENITAEEAHFGSSDECTAKQNLLEGVSQWQITDVNVVMIDVKSSIFRACGSCNEVAMGEFGCFGVTSSA